MAQGQGPVATMALAGLSSMSGQLTKEDMHAIQQCDRIVQFRDAIVSGVHPRIKLPAHLAGPRASTAGNVPSSILPAIPSQPSNRTAQAHQAENFRSFASNAHHTTLPGLGITSVGTVNSLPVKPFTTSNAEIDPIFLEKSDDLIKAEIQLQRQRVERALRDQIDQRRASIKASAQIEPVPDFDLSDVLSKALTLVQATATTLSGDTNPAANTAAASDSFDENSYYSSQHNTPDSHQSSRARVESEGAPIQNTSNSENPVVPGILAKPNDKNEKQALLAPPSDSRQLTTHNTQQREQAQLLASGRPMYTHDPNPSFAHVQSAPSTTQATRVTEYDKQGGSISGEASGEASRSVESGNLDMSHSGDQPHPLAGQGGLGESLLAHQPSPLLQVHPQNMSPVAPQPSHVSPLATARRSGAMEQDLGVLQGTPAQVAALRQRPMAISSPDSSPQGGRISDRKKGKKKKGKKAADRQALVTVDSLHIKVEPRSPSPTAAPSFARPSKRQKHAQRLANTHSHDDRMYDPAAPELVPHERYPSGTYRDVVMPDSLSRQDEYHERRISRSVIPVGHNYQPQYVEEPRAAGAPQYIREPQSPGVYAIPHATGDVHRINPPVSADRQYREPPIYYRQEYEVTRTRSRSPVMRDGRQSAMGPPKLPARVVVDSYGRQYYEPQPQPSIRHSVGPALTVGEPDVIYGRSQPRPQSIRPSHAYEDDVVVYGAASPSYGAPRRVVTQPEYGIPPEHRAYRQREYSVRPVAYPGDEYTPLRGAATRRQLGEFPQEHATRATTARPAETFLYDVSHEYSRTQSIRPDTLVREYSSTVLPDARREIIQPGAREYSVRPAEPHPARREYSVRPVEQYYGHTLRDDGLGYAEPPRPAPQNMMYTDQGRQVYID